MAILDNKAGFTPDNLPELIEKAKQDFKSIYGDELNLDNSTIDTNLIQILCQYGVNLQEQFSYILNQLNPQTAESIYLDNLSKLLGLSRRIGKGTRILVRVNNTHPSNIIKVLSTPAEPFYINDKDGNQYVADYLASIENQNSLPYNQMAYIIPAQSHLDIPFTMTQSGGIVPVGSDYSTDWTVKPSTISMQGTEPDVLKYLTLNQTNPISIQLGTDGETDEELRFRLIKGSEVGLTSKEGLLQKLLEVDGVFDCLIIENDGTETSFTDKNDEMKIKSPKYLQMGTEFEVIPKNHLYIILDGGTYDSQKVGDLIRKNKSDGVGLIGFDFTGANLVGCRKVVINSLSELFGYTQITFQVSKIIPVKMTIKVIPKTTTSSMNNLQLDKNSLKDYIIKSFSTNNQFLQELSKNDIELICSQFDNRFRYSVELLDSYWNLTDGSPRDSMDSTGLLSKWIFAEKWGFNREFIDFTGLN